ncbi:hypothetical protein [Methylorubrum populi]|uniref:Uncharacterized protein n=1 Tax=Methylorubrum populi TaxID=223967 RepID=A0A833IZX1_9HYPH|nr:hypothetical protein [Methylorubrum populi]KAB7781975.1 hypothetical protein F8B43_5584 [Methylorubrum populi]
MALYFITDQPQALLEAFEARVRQSEPRGRIDIWKRSEDGALYTHAADEWSGKAWLKPRVDADRLTFNILRPEDRYVSVKAYAFYYGQLIETFTGQLDLTFESVAVTPRCTDGDLWA